MTDTTARHTTWSVTINNPGDEDTMAVHEARQKGWKVSGQAEKGEGGTLHLQLMVKTPQCRFSAMKKAFPRAHIEPARNEVALQKYVTKEETRVGELPSSEKYPSMSTLWDILFTRNNTEAKDGWDMAMFPEVELYDSVANLRMKTKPLEWFDTQIHYLIQEGYHVETLATNPAVRSAWKNFWPSILTRSFHKMNNIAEEHNHALEEEVHIPTPEDDAAPPVSQDGSAYSEAT